MFKLIDRHTVIQALFEVISRHFLKLSLLEWRLIWFKCLGKVLLLNGTSSSGKSTAARYFSYIGFQIISIDELYDNVLYHHLIKHCKHMARAVSFLVKEDLDKLIAGYRISENLYSDEQVYIVALLQAEINYFMNKGILPNKLQMYTRVFEIVKQAIFSGYNVLVDLLATERSLQQLLSCFGHYPVTIALVYCALEDNLWRCLNRNILAWNGNKVDFRSPAMLMAQYEKFYGFVGERNVMNAVDIVNKKSVCEILPQAQKMDELLYAHTRVIRYRDRDDYYRGMDLQAVSDVMNKKIARIKKDMQLSSTGNVYIIPSVRFDILLRSISSVNDAESIMHKLGFGY